jgi:hypothetical protein
MVGKSQHVWYVYMSVENQLVVQLAMQTIEHMKSTSYVKI